MEIDKKLLEPMVFDADESGPIEIPVTIGATKYVLREATEQAARVYRNAAVAGARLQNGQMSSLAEDLAGVQSLLLSHCLFRIKEGKPAQKPVHRDIILGWVARIVRPMFEWVMEVSGLNVEDDTLESLQKELEGVQKRTAELKDQEDPAKNGVTTTGS